MKAFSFFLFLFFIQINLLAQTSGCTDPLANNFNANATINDGSCLYNQATISPVVSFVLDSVVKETSGLIFWQNKLWTLNDDGDNSLYALDTLNGAILSSTALTGLENIDWEEVSQDDSFVYVGDFGNNVSGNRANLRIYKIGKQSILQNNPFIDTIAFSYADQIDFSTHPVNQTDFDCEAFVLTSDSIYLFTKQWISNKTTIYALSKSPGTHIAQNSGSLNVEGLITGSVLLNDQQLIVLSGYSDQLQPFIYLLYDFEGSDFFGGNKRKLQLDLPFHQVEGITTNNGLKFFITNEAFSYSPIFVDQQMHILDLKNYLINFLYPEQTGIDLKKKNKVFSVTPNPARNKVVISNIEKENVVLYNLLGKILAVPQIKSHNSCQLDLKDIPSGIYMISIKGASGNRSQILIKE